MDLHVQSQAGSGANGLRLVADLPTPNKGKSGVS